MAKKAKHEEHENHERWLVSYADFITLLFAFFVVMYSVSSVNEGKYRAMSDSLEAAFQASPRSPLPIQIGMPAKSINMSNPFQHLEPPIPSVSNIKKEMERKRNRGNPPKPINLKPLGGAASGGGQQDKAMQAIVEETKKALGSLIRGRVMTVRQTQYRVEVELDSNVLFRPGSARLQDQATPILARLGRILSKYPNEVRVEGYTDNTPINSVQFPSNWELSANRAASVIHWLVREGVEPRRLAAVGYAQHRPKAANVTAEGRKKNRRVVIVIFANTAPRQVTGASDFRPRPPVEPATETEPPLALGDIQTAATP